MAVEGERVEEDDGDDAGSVVTVGEVGVMPPLVGRFRLMGESAIGGMVRIRCWVQKGVRWRDWRIETIRCSRCSRRDR